MAPGGSRRHLAGEMFPETLGDALIRLLGREAQAPGLNPERRGRGRDGAPWGRGGGREEAPLLKPSPPHPAENAALGKDARGPSGDRGRRKGDAVTWAKDRTCLTEFPEGLVVNLNEALRGFPGSSVAKNPPATAGDSGPGRSPFLGATKPAGATTEPVLLSPRTAALSPCVWRPSSAEGACAARKSRPTHRKQQKALTAAESQHGRK